MPEHIITDITIVLFLGIAAQWIAWRLKLPSIVFLLLFGFIAGPVTGFLNPDEFMGELLVPFVSLSVAIILFEGGLTLRVSELKEVGRIIFFMVTVGVFITCGFAAISAHYLFGLNTRMAVLLGAILVVTGPTVIGPLLRFIRPIGKVTDILKWEGIVTDPIGALMAVLVFEAVLIGGMESTGATVLLGLVKTIVFGTLFGGLFAAFLILLLKNFWIPEYLTESITLTLVLGAYMGSNFFQEESGLFAATLMGIMVVNQNWVPVKNIMEFKENLRLLIISVLFIILSARIKLNLFFLLSINSLAFLGILILLARPTAVFVSTMNADLTWREKLFLSWMAPRGIVAAAVSSIFALRLNAAGFPQAGALVPLTFTVIMGTVIFYGLTALPMARWLKLDQSNPQGVLFLGALPWAVELAKILQEKNFNVLMTDTYRPDIFHAKMAGVPVYYNPGLTRELTGRLQLNGIGRLMAITPNDELNSLAILHFSEMFDREELYQLAPAKSGIDDEQLYSPQHLRGRYLFGKDIDYAGMTRRFQSGSVIKATTLTEAFDYAAFKDYYGASAIPMALITDKNNLLIFTTDKKMTPHPGQTLIAMVDEPDLPEGRI